MTYLIAAVLLILIIVLILLFRAPKVEKPVEEDEPAILFPEDESVGEGELVSPGVESQADQSAAVDELAVEEPEKEVAAEDYTDSDVAVEQETVVDAEYPELSFDTDQEKIQGDVTVQEDEYTELSLDTEEIHQEGREHVEEEQYTELSLDADETVTEPPEDTALVSEDTGEETDVAPALAGSLEESEIQGEAPPEELVDKLDYYFGKDEIPPSEETESAAADELPAEEEESAVYEGQEGEFTESPTVEKEAGLEEEAVVPEVAGEELTLEEAEVAAELTREKYAENQQNIEAGIRQELAAVKGENETDRRSVLEQKLQVICEKQASIEGNYHRQIQLIDTTRQVLEKVQSVLLQKDLPGLQIEKVERQLQFGNYKEVETMLAEASLQLDHESELYSSLYYLCGQFAEERLDYDSAFEDYRNACAADKDNSAYLLAAGGIARKLGNDQDAQFWLEKLVRDGTAGEEQTVEQLNAQHELGLVCVRMGEKEKADTLFKKSIEIGEAVLGRDHPDLGPVMHDYAVYLENNGMYEQAEEFYGNALEALEKGCGIDHPKLGATLNKLAGLYEELELGEKAESLYERALAIKERVLGKDHHDVGVILSNLAELLRNQGKLEQSEPLFKRSLDISEQELGKDHPNLAVILNNMAELYSQMGREEDAALYQERAFSLFELPGMDGDFVEMEKDDVDIDDDKNKSITGD